MTPEHITAQEIAKLLGRSKNTVLKNLAQAEIEPIDCSTHRNIFHFSDIQAKLPALAIEIAYAYQHTTSF